MKKILGAICVIILSILSINVALAYDVYQYGDFTVRIENGVAEISKYNGYEMQPYIPSAVTINGKAYLVTKIGSFAFKDNSSIIDITIPYPVKTIENSAFKGCSNLTVLNLGDSLQTIEYSAFEDCTSLDMVLFPESVSTIQTSAFSGCYNLEVVRLSSNLTSIPSGCFKECLSLSEIIIPDGVKVIDTSAFSSCVSLKKISIPSSVMLINASAFSNCSDELTIYGVPGSFAEEYAAKYRIRFSCNHQNTAIDKAIAPTCENTGFTEGKHCSACNVVLVKQEVVPALGHVETAISAIPATHVTTGLTEGRRCNRCDVVLAEQEVTPLVRVQSMITFPKALSIIKEEAFVNGTFECVVIPDGCMMLRAKAFAGNTFLKFVEIPESVIEIDETAFADCNENLIFVTTSGSAAAVYAEEHSIYCVYK